MNISLAGKKILIIGGARGIGAQIVRDCASSGAAAVAWTYFSSSGEKATSELANELASAGKEFLSFKVDSTDEKATLELFNTLRQKWGRIDGLVYNAGFTSPRDFCDISYEEWKRVVDINLNGAFLAVREGVQMMKDSGGAIVLIGSAAITSGGGGRADYVAAKAGLEGLNRAVTKYFAKDRIRCNIVHPSLIETDLLCQRHPDPEKRKTLGEKEVPLGRLGQVEDISNAAIFLLSDQSGYITAQSILVDGGRSYCK